MKILVIPARCASNPRSRPHQFSCRNIKVPNANRRTPEFQIYQPSETPTSTQTESSSAHEVTNKGVPSFLSPL
jgi:hypothetical protein